MGCVAESYSYSYLVSCAPLPAYDKILRVRGDGVSPIGAPCLYIAPSRMGKGAALLLAGLSLLAAVRAQDSVCHPTADEVRASFLPAAGACVPPAPDPEEEPKMRGAALH